MACPCAETTPPTMHASPSTATPGITFIVSRKAGFAPNRRLKRKPSPTGMSVTRSTLLNIPMASTSTISPASQSIRNGVVRGASSVESVVMPTENATSPLQRKLMMFEETPPGQHPTRMRPTATPLGIPSRCVRPKAMSGIRANCASEPIAMSSGREASTLKSCGVSVMPIVSMITPSTAVCV